MVRLCVYNLNFVYINCFVVVILVVVIRPRNEALAE